MRIIGRNQLMTRKEEVSSYLKQQQQAGMGRIVSRRIRVSLLIIA